MKPSSLAVPTKATDDAPEATPRTIDGGPLVEPDAYGIYHAANTPVGHRGSRGSRSGFTAAGTSENRAEQLLISQMQTPERQRVGQASYIVASPLPNLSSPRMFSSPNPVPLFHPSPKRHGLQSPGHQSSSFEALFQSPMRGLGSELQAAAELLRFETPSRHPALDSLLSPSPSRHNRRGAPGSQPHRRPRAVAFDAAAWRPGDDVGLGDAQQGLSGGDDADFDLVRNLLQSPGPKEVQQLPMQHEQQRSKLGGRSTSSGPGSPWAAADAAAGAAGDGSKPPAHVRRRALDFSKAESMHSDLQVPPALRRSASRPPSSSTSPVSLASLAAAEQQQQQRDELPLHGSRFQPHLPLLPLDLSECERHNPSSTTGLTPQGPSSTRSRQQGGFDPFTSPHSALDAAAAVVAGQAMGALRSMHGSSSHEQQQQVADAALRSMAALPNGAFESLGSSGSKLKSEAAATASERGRSSNKAALPMMVPLDGLSAAAAAGTSTDIAREVLHLLKGGHSRHQQDQQQGEQPDATGDPPAVHKQAADQGAKGSSAAAAAGSGSAGKRGSQRQQGKKAGAGGSGDVQPSRRSRRIAGGTPEGPEQQQQERERTASPAPLSNGSGGRSRRSARRTAASTVEAEAADEPEGQQQQEVDDTSTAMDVDVDADADADQQQQQQQQDDAEQLQQQLLEGQQQLAHALALAAAMAGGAEAAAAAEDEAADAEDDTSRRPRSRTSSRKAAGQKGRGSSRAQQQQQVNLAYPAVDAAAEAEAAAAAGFMAAGLDAAALAQQAALLPGGYSQLAQLQMLPGYGVTPEGYGVTPDKRGARVAGGLLGPGTPDDVRLAHMGLQYTPTMRSCHCKKSQCLKLYCDCFANNTYCNGCACRDCKNVEANAQEVMARRINIQQRDPNAFTHKLAQRADTLTNRKGCKCKKSHCLKKYCECYQLGVRCGDLCKCSDCHNIDLDGTLQIPTAALLQRTAMQLTASGGPQGRVQHAAAAAAAAAVPLWPLGQGLPAVSAAATPGIPLGMSTQAQLLLRLQNGGPGTPGSAPMVGGLAMQHSTPQAADDDGSAEAAGAGDNCTPLSAVAATPQPPKFIDKSSLRSTAKPLLPQFMQAAAAAAAGAGGDRAAPFAEQLQKGSTSSSGGAGGGGSSSRRMQLHTAADGSMLADDDEVLPTPDQAGAEQHVFSMRGTGTQQEARAAASAEAAAAAAAAAAAVHEQYDAAALAAMPLGYHSAPEPAAYQQQQRPGFISSPVQDPSSRLCQPQKSPAAAPTAAASSSSGGDSRPGAMSSAVQPGSAGSKGRHRLASSSRAYVDDASTRHVQQPQQSGLAALVPGAAQQPALQTRPMSHQGSHARRQLLQQIHEEAAGLSDLADLHPWSQAQAQQYNADDSSCDVQHQGRVAAGSGNAAAGSALDGGAAVGSGGGNKSSNSPGQAVMLGPDGPMVVLPQHMLRSAMHQSAAALNASAAVQAGGGDAAGQAAAAAAAAGPDEPRQTPGMLMTVVDDQGQVQYYFLPNSQPDASAAADDAVQDATMQQHEQDVPAGQQQEPVYALRTRAHKTHHAVHNDPMQVDSDAATGGGMPQQPCAQQQQEPQRMVTRHYQQQQQEHEQDQQQQQEQQVFTTPTKCWPPAESDAAAAAGLPSGRNLRSSGSAVGGGGGSSSKTTPQKRATPVKRSRADGEDVTPATSPQQAAPGRTKLPHQVSPPGINPQASPSQPVVLSPVKLAPSALPGAYSSAATAGALDVEPSSTRPARSTRARRQTDQAQLPQPQLQHPQTSPQQQQQQQQQEMQLFLATTADGRQLLLRAPAGTDPQSLIAPDGSVQSCYLAAVLPSSPVTSQPPAPPASTQQQQQGQLSAQQQQQQQQEQFSSPSKAATPRQQLAVDLPPLYASPGKQLNSPSKLMRSPSDTRPRDVGLLRFSPGKTVFSPKGSSPSKPLLGHSPSKSQGSGS